MRRRKATLLALAAITTLAVSSTALADTKEVTPGQVSVQTAEKNGVNLISIETDAQGRPIKASFIGNDANQLGRRSQKNPPNPANLDKWTNQKIASGYLWDRGHLIGDQFAGYASNNPLNLVGETAYLNKTLMLYHEGGTKSANDNALDNWLYLHPNYYIEYHVLVHWADADDKYPTAVTLQYRGLDKQGNPIEIKIPQLEAEGAGKQTVDANLMTSVTLQNIQPGYIIDYKTGKATQDTSHVGNQDLYEGQDLGTPSTDPVERAQKGAQKTYESNTTPAERDLISSILAWIEAGVREFMSRLKP